MMSYLSDDEKPKEAHFNLGVSSSLLQFFFLQNNEILINSAQSYKHQAGFAIEKSTLQDIKPKKHNQGSARQAVIQFFLMKAPFISVGTEKSLDDAEMNSGFMVLDNLPGFQGAVDIVLGDPMTHAFAIGEMLEICGQFADFAFNRDSGVDKALIAHAVRFE